MGKQNQETSLALGVCFTVFFPPQCVASASGQTATCGWWVGGSVFHKGRELLCHRLWRCMLPLLLVVLFYFPSVRVILLAVSCCRYVHKSSCAAAAVAAVAATFLFIKIVQKKETFHDFFLCAETKRCFYFEGADIVCRSACKSREEFAHTAALPGTDYLKKKILRNVNSVLVGCTQQICALASVIGLHLHA